MNEPLLPANERALLDRIAEAERQIRDNESLLNLLKEMLNRMEHGIILMNAERIVEVCNRRAIELLGLPEALMASTPSFDDVLAFQWSTDEFRHTSQDVQEFIKSGRILEKATSYDRKRPDGRVIEVLTVPIGNGGALRTYTDITDGDEFAVLQYGTGRAQSASALAARMLEAIAQPIEIESFHSSISASIGIAHYPGDGTDQDTLMRNADRAMYAAKVNGGGRAQVFGAENGAKNDIINAP